MDRHTATEKLSKWHRFNEVKLQGKNYLAKYTCACNGTGIYGWACDPKDGMKFDKETGKNTYNSRHTIPCYCLEEIKGEENVET